MLSIVFGLSSVALVAYDGASGHKEDKMRKMEEQ